MANDSRVAVFLARNKESAKSHQPIALLKDTLFATGPNPRGNIVIVSCFDVRVQPTAFFGLRPGDANIISNAGGRVDADTIRSLIVLDSIAGVGTVIVVHHTDCGLTHVSDEELRMMLEEKAPQCTELIEGMKFGEIKDLSQSVKDDLEIMDSNPLVRKDIKILGFIYDITDGTVKQVKVM